MRRLLIPALTAALLVPAASAQAKTDRDMMYQVSTLQALQVGLLQPAMSIKSLHKHGDFGLGTFTGLNGEMVVDQGKVFQVPISGRARVADDCWQTPFAAVTFFDADRKFTIKQAGDLATLGSTIDKRLPTTNIFYAVRITGKFDHVQTRSVPGQKPPYPTLSDVVAQQRTFDLKDVAGTLVGIRSPQYVGSLNVPGYHWHFISSDGKAGGHVLAMSAEDLRVRVDPTRRWTVKLPKTKAFAEADLD